MSTDLSGGQAAGVQRQHDRVHVAQAALPLLDDHRLERAVPVPRHLDLHRSALSVNTVLDRVPLRELPPLRPSAACLS